MIYVVEETFCVNFGWKTLCSVCVEASLTKENRNGIVSIKIIQCAVSIAGSSNNYICESSVLWRYCGIELG